MQPPGPTHAQGSPPSLPRRGLGGSTVPPDADVHGRDPAGPPRSVAKSDPEMADGGGDTTSGHGPSGPALAGENRPRCTGINRVACQMPGPIHRDICKSWQLDLERGVIIALSPMGHAGRGTGWVGWWGLLHPQRLRAGGTSAGVQGCTSRWAHKCKGAGVRGCASGGVHGYTGCSVAGVHEYTGAQAHGCTSAWVQAGVHGYTSAWVQGYTGCRGAWAHKCMGAWVRG